MQESPDLAELYRIRFASAASLSRKQTIWRVLCAHWFQRFIRESDTVVDVACGYGEFINNIRAARRIAVDLNADARACVSPEVEFHQQPATELASLGESIADVVFTSNFLEHLPDKAALEVFLAQARRVLKPGGRLIIMGPNLRYLPGEYWDFYDHHLGLTHLSLSEVLRLKGYGIERCIDKFLPYTTQGHLPTHPLLVRLYLMMPLAWPFVGRQFFIIATRAPRPE